MKIMPLKQPYPLGMSRCIVRVIDAKTNNPTYYQVRWVGTQDERPELSWKDGKLFRLSGSKCVIEGLKTSFYYDVKWLASSDGPAGFCNTERRLEKRFSEIPAQSEKPPRTGATH